MFFKKLQSYCWRYFCDIDFSCKLQAIIAGFFKSVRAVSLCLFLFVFLFIAKLSYAIDVDSFKSLKALLESNIDYSAEIIKFNLSISTDSNFSANPILIGANKTIDGQGQYSFSFANSSVSKTNAASVIDNQALHVLTFQNFNLIIFKDNYSNPPTSSLERWGIVSNVGAKINFAASSIAFLNNVSGNYVGGTISNRSNSTMTFSNVSITFASNASGSGAAFENADASLITFENSTTVFMDNKSWMDGAVNNIYGAIINIANSNFIFDSNEGFLYGAISNWNGNGTDGAASLIKVSNSQISFKDNYAGMWGGAIYNDYGSLTAFVNSKIDFTKNGAGNVGGAIYNGQNSSVTFINSSVNFIENYVDGSTAAGVGGFAIYNDSTSLGKGISYMLFSGSTVNFSGNKYQGADKYYGEAVYNTGTLIFENSKINFTNVANSTSIYQNGGSLKISRGEISFSSHTNISWTFANNYSNIIFNPSIAAFYNNSSKIGGGGSTMTDIFTIIEKVRNGRLLAYQNINTAASGGFLHIGNRSVAFGAVTFSSNSTTAPKDSGYGGAVNVLNSSVSFFSDNQDSIFDYNTAVKGGGAFNVDKSTIYFLSAKGKVLFDQNRSPTDSAGAALIYFSNAIFENVSFTSNTAGADSGALSVNSNAKVWINQKENINTQSYGNRAGSYGGAINVDAGLLTFNLLANSSMHFYDNIAYYGKANQMQNDLSLNLAASSAVFNVAGGASLIFDSGIRAANGGFIGKFGTGSLSLGGDNYFNNLTQPFSPTGQFNVSNSTFTWIMGNNKTNFLAANNSNVTFTNSSVSFITIAGESSLSVQTSAIDIAKYFAEDNSQVLFKFINSNVLIKDRIHAVDAKANGSGIYINTRGQLNSSLRFYFEGGSLSVINTSASWGSALYVRGNEKSIVDFSTTTVFFKDNISFLGSAIFLGTVKSKINFFNVTKSSFISNITTLAGGAIFLTDQSAFKVMGNSEIYFISNVSSGIGGAAVYLEDNSLSAFKVENSSMYFSKNISTNTGGALYIGSSNSFTVNNSYLNFSSNSAQEFGGAIYINENAALSFINSNVDFIANRSLDSGSAIFAFKNSTVSFIGGSNEDRNIVNIIGQFSRSHGGIVARFGSVIKMQNIIVNSFYNSSTYAGALNAEKSSFLVLENVSLNSISNYAEVGSAFLLNTESSATVVNADINFSSNVDKNNGAVFLDKSRAYFKNSGEIIISSNTAMSAGAVYLSVSTLTFDGAKKILFSNNTSSDAANSAGAIYLNNSILTFSNAEITFINNRHINGIKNDINLVNKSQLIFSGDVLLPNGVIVKNDGSSFLKKTKTGNLIFDGTAVINSSFAIEQGTASFRYGAKLSSVSFLDIGKTAALSFKDGFAGGMLFVKTLNLNGFIEVDADFTNATADSFNFAGAGSERNLIVNTSTIIVSRSGALEDSSPVPFINFGASLASFKNQFENNITVLGAGRHYGLSVDKQNNNLAKIMILPKWNWFADEYKKVKANETVYLDGWTIAAEQFDANGKANAVKIGTSINKTFFIDGNNYGLNASNFEGFGFVLQQSSITFKDISFSNFALSNSTGSVINAANSTLTFRGNIKFSSNGVSYNAEMLGGAFYAFRTKVNFEDANVEFSSNVGRGLATGGAITASYSSFSFVNSSISFLENTAFGMAAFNFIQESVISFINSNVSFLNNQAVYNSGAIRLDGSSKFFAQNSFLVFSGNSASNHLTGAFYLNSAYAQLSNSTVVFSNNSVQGDGGAVVIRSGAELVVKFSSLTFLSNKTAFRNLNTGVGTGGALSIITANSVVNISFSTVYFINNIANTGGALSNFGKLYVSNSLMYFTSNSAVQNDTSSFGSNGGALWLSTNSKSVFENSSVYFTSNSAAGYGGAIYLDENAVLSFINSDLNFIGNKDVKDGGAIYALKNSTISFRGASNENRNTINIIGQVSNAHGGIVVRSSSVVKMQNIIVNSFYNSSTYAGTLNAEVTAFFVLENVKLNSMLNYAFTGTSFLLNSFSSATLINVDIDFSSNTDANRLGATFYVERSAIHLKNSGSIILSSNTASFSGAEASISGALRIDRATAVFDGAKEIIFANNLALSTLGQSAGAILLTASELTFSNTEIIFKNNFKNAGAEANDIFMNNSKLIFSGDNVLPNGVIIKESGKSIIRKIGEGSLTFEGFTSISSSFTIEQGTVNFRNNAAQSNVDILQISNGASLSFKDGSVGGILKVGESLSLGGFIEIDANFTGIGGTKGADYFSMIGGGANKKLTVAVTTVIVNRLDINQRSVDSVLFIDAGMDLSPLIDKLENIKVLGADRHYGITLGADKKQAVLALLPKWNFFVEDFKTALKGQTIYLYGQTFAADQKSAESVINAKPIGLTTGEFFIDGKGFSLNAQNSALQKLGFVLDKASVTFVNISLEGFLAQNSSGAVVFAQKSTLTFAGDISFLENTVFALANTGGGALFAKDAALNFEGNIKFSSNVSLNGQGGGAIFIDNSRLNFIDANVSFSSNIARKFGGALFAKSSKVNFINSTVSFFSNQAQANGAGIYLSLSTIIFTNTQSLFAQNTSNNTLNDIYFADKNSAIIFDENNIIASGLIVFGEGFIQKVGSKTLTFKGSLQAQESGFIADGGFIEIDGKAALKNFYAINSSAIFNDTFISNDINWGNSAASFLQAVITSSVNINKSTISFVQTLNSSGIFITNSLADFSSEVLASSVTLTNSSANFTGDANFRGDIFAEKSFSQFLSQVTAGGAIINNSTIIFTGAILSGNLLIRESYVSFSNSLFANILSVKDSTGIFTGGATLSADLLIENSFANFVGGVLTSSVGINNSTASFAGTFKSSDIFIINSLADFSGEVLASSVTLTNSSANFTGDANFRGDIFAEKSFSQFFSQLNAKTLTLNSSSGIFSGGTILSGDLLIENSFVNFVGEVLTSSVGINNSTASFAGTFKSSDIFIINSLADFSGEVLASSVTLTNSSVNFTEVANFRGDIFAEKSFLQFLSQLNAKTLTLNNSTGIFSGEATLSGDLLIENSFAGFTGGVLTSSVGVNNSTASFAGTFKSSDIFITNSLANFSSEVLASSVTLLNSSANFTGDANFRGDIFVEKSFLQFLLQVTAGGAIINNSTIIFAGAILSGDLLIKESYVSFSNSLFANILSVKDSTGIFSGEATLSGDLLIENSFAGFTGGVLTSSVGINNSTANFTGIFKSSNIFITNSLADFSSEVLASSVTLLNSSVNFTGDANFRGDIFAEKSFSQFLSQLNAKTLTLNNSTGIFSGEATLSGDLLIENSFAGFTGGVLTSSVGINNSTASFAGTFKSSDIFIINSLVNFTQTAGASVSAQTISFMNSNAAFSGKSNFTGGILSQDSLLEFLAEVNAGNAMLNRSYITFEKNAILQNLQMAGSTVNFKSAVSTAANLIANDSFIFLQDGIAASSLYVTGDFSLINSRWAIDANFSNIDGGFADWIGVGGNFNISNSTLSVNDLGKGKKILTILTAFNSSIDISSLYITEGYNLKVENNSILLAADALWNSFVKLFNNAPSASPIVLPNNISADEENNPSVFSAPSGNNLVLNGKNNILDSGAYNNLGFIFTNDNANEGKNITFQNTSFINFKSTLNGAFLFSKGSTVTFMGTAETDGKMSISSNTAISGGAIYAQISSIYFVNGTFEISSNSAIAGGQGGAIWADKSNIVFMNSTAAFYSNKADQEGGAVYLTGSTLAFIKTDIAFYNGESVSNDVFLNSSVLSIEHENNIVQILGGLYVMDESEVLVKGGIGGNIGFVEMSNNLTFENIAKFEIGNSAFIKIIDSTFTYSSNFSPVKLSASTITFTNSSITFLSDTSSDFELDENSALLFNGQNIFTRDLSISGAGFVEKFGAGILSFEGALYAKEISFIVHGGSVSVNAKTEAKDFYVVNTSAVFNDNFDSRDLSFTNSLVNFVGAVNGSSAAIINSSANIKGLANFAGDIFVQDSFMQALAQLNANALSINNSTGVFSTLNLAGNLDSLNSYLSFTDEVLASSINVNNSTAVFAGALKSSAIFINNSLTDFEGVSAGSITMINSSANIKGLANFAGDIFVQDSFMQTLAQLNANAFSINNSTGLFSTANLAGNLDSVNSYLSFTDEVLTSSINVNNSTAVFAGALKSSGIFINNSLTDFGAVSAGSITMINSSASIKGSANFAGDIFVEKSFMQNLTQLNAHALRVNNSTGFFVRTILASNLDSVNSYLSFTDEVLTSSINVNNSTAVFAGALKSSGIFINNSLIDFGAVSAGSITMINSSANIKGLANFAGDIFVQDSFMQTLAQLNANAFSINNSTGFFSTLNLAGNLDSLNSYLSFTDEVLTSSINVNNSTAVFTGALKSSGIFINNSLTDFGAVSAGSITMINSNVNIGGIADFTGNISADNSHVKFLQQTKGQDASFNNAQIVFEKDLLLNELSILASSVNFKSGVSTVSVLNVSHGFMSLQNGIAASSFYVLGNFSLEGSFAIDVNFEDALTDWISVGGNFSVDKSTLVINRLDGDKYYFNPLEFLRADRLNYDAKRFFVDPAYQIILGADGKSLLISMANEYGAWNIFVNSFRTYQDSQNPLVLQADIDAAAEINASPQAFASPQGGGFSVDGAGFSLNAKNDKAQNLGFIFYESSFTFKQITFKNFLAQSSSGAVFYAQNSSITFIGNINFLNNTLSASNDTGGGAIFAQNTQLNFEGAADTNSKIEFSSNVSLNGAGGALFIDEAETYFANVNIRFTSNSAQGNGGAIYLNGLLTFSNSTIAFINNFAGAKLNDIYFAAAQSELVFSGDNVLTNGIKTSGAGSIKKIDEGTLVFEGSPAIILNAFDIEAGTVNFKSNISTISVLRVQNDALLSLVNGDTGGRLFTEELIFTDAYLAFDVNFSNGLADKIVVDQIFSSNANSHFLLNVLSQIGDEIAILIETNSEISNIQEIYTANEDYEVYGGGYFIFARSKDSSSLPPAVISATDWKEFVNEYKYAPKVNGDWIELSKNIIASQGDENIDRSAAQVSFNIDGKNKILDADNQKTGFVLDAAAIAFKDITFKNFAGAQGAVIRALNKSSVTFLGTINFVNNQSDIYLNDSALYFNDVIFVNGLRTQGTGEVIKFGGGAAVFRDGIFVKNKMQIKNNPGLVPRVSNFEGSTNIENVFNVQDGSVIFESAVSSVAVMHVGQGAVVSLKDNNPSGALYVGQLELGKNVHLWFDIDFENSLSDIIVSTSAIVFGEGIVLNINNVSKDLFATNSVEIIFSGSQIDYSKIVYDSSKYSLGFGKTNNILQITNYAPPALRFDDLTSNQENVLNNINENYHLVGMILNLQDQAKQKQALDSLSSAFYANIFTQELHNNAKDLFMQLRHNELHNIWINISFSALEFRRPNQMLGVFNESGIGLNVGANILSNKLFRAGIITQLWSKNFSQLDNTANLLSLGIGGYADASIKGLNIGMVMQAKRGQGKVKRSIELDRVYGPQGDIRLFGFNESLNLNYMFDIVKTKRDQISAGPFVNADFSQINTREIIEEGGGLANLNVASQNLMQSMFHYGLQLKRQTNFYKVFAQGFVGQNLSPTQKIKTKFANTANNDFWEIESDETNEMFYGAQLGVSVNAGKFMQFLVMGNYQENDNYKNYTAGVQAQYQFLVKMPQALPKNLDMPKLQFVENSARLTKESQIALANFARHFAREKYIFKTMKIVFRINKSNDKVSQSANKLNFERAQNVKKVLAQNKMSARKVVLATKVSSAKTKISVRIVR